MGCSGGHGEGGDKLSGYSQDRDSHLRFLTHEMQASKWPKTAGRPYDIDDLENSGVWLFIQLYIRRRWEGRERFKAQNT